MRTTTYRTMALMFLLTLGVGSAEVFAAGGEGAGHVQLSTVLFALIILLLAAKVGGELFERRNQPAVLGELVVGVVLGNLSLIGITALDPIKTHAGIAFVAEVGVILLLFEVGLESNLDELLAVGASATIVAVLGIVAPVILGYGVSYWFLPDAGWYVHLFVGATLAATSVGITARVLKDIGKMDTKEARIILAAAVVDDVLGLIILAVVSGLVSSIGGGAEISLIVVLTIIGKAVAFLGVAIVVGRKLAGQSSPHRLYGSGGGDAGDPHGLLLLCRRGAGGSGRARSDRGCVRRRLGS